jgi:tetratricopeptide (TPR) repeat protein
MTLDEIKVLIDTGDFSAALQNIAVLHPKDQLMGNVLKVRILTEQLEYQEALSLADEVITLSQQLNQPILEFEALVAKANVLCYRGDVDEALRTVEASEDLLTTFSVEERECLHLAEAILIQIKGMLYQAKGAFDQALECYQKSLTTFVALGDKRYEASLYYTLSFFYIAIKESKEQALEYIQKSLAIIETLNTKRDTVRVFFLQGIIHFWNRELNQALNNYQRSLTMIKALGWHEGVGSMISGYPGKSNLYRAFALAHYANNDLDLALEYFQKSLAIRKKIGNKYDIAESHLTIGELLHCKGELDQVMEHLNKSLVILEPLRDSKRVYPYNMLGNTFRDKGELERALKCYKKSLTLTEALIDAGFIHLKFFTTIIFNNIGRTYFQQGKLDQARDFFERSYTLQKSSGNDHEISRTLFELLRVELSLQNESRVNQLLLDLEEINTRTKSSFINLLYRLSQALILKHGKRVKEKAKAQQIFEDIVSEKIFDYIYTVFAINHLCDLLLDELKTYGEQDVFDEVKELIQKLSEIGQEQSSFSVLVNALVLQSKLSLLEGNLSLATQLLEQALRTAEEKGLILLQENVKKEQTILESQIEEWQSLVERNASMYERINQARLQEYLNEAQKMVRKVDSPIMEPTSSHQA